MRRLENKVAVITGGAQGIGKAIWAGHSMGGQISIVAALNFPASIDKLVLLKQLLHLERPIRMDD